MIIISINTQQNNPYALLLSELQNVLLYSLQHLRINKTLSIVKIIFKIIILSPSLYMVTLKVTVGYT